MDDSRHCESKKHPPYHHHIPQCRKYTVEFHAVFLIDYPFRAGCRGPGPLLVRNENNRWASQCSFRWDMKQNIHGSLVFLRLFSHKLITRDLLSAFRPAYIYIAGKWVDQGSWVRFFHLPVNRRIRGGGGHGNSPLFAWWQTLTTGILRRRKTQVENEDDFEGESIATGMQSHWFSYW